ncbi:MAG TPA: DUF4258 domain-containing protein [Rhabdochlamydiaceae bacterium]|jgi:hypothetical protein
MAKKSDGYFKDTQLYEEILKHIYARKYRLTKHAMEELKKDDLELRDAIYVLKTGEHNSKKTGYDIHNQTWKYAIEGKAEDLKKSVRVIIAFVDEMLIITAMEL